MREKAVLGAGTGVVDERSCGRFLEPGTGQAALCSGECAVNPIKTVEGRAYPLGLKNVDTDMVIAAKWLKTITRAGMGKGAFEALRQDPAPNMRAARS
jgi:hypothetical protein